MAQSIEINIDESIVQDQSLKTFFNRTGSKDYWYWDLNHPEHAFFSPELYASLGYTPEEVKSNKEIISNDQVQKAIKLLYQFLEKSISIYEIELDFLNSNNQKVIVCFSAVALRDNQGSVLRVLGSFKHRPDSKLNPINKNIHSLLSDIKESAFHILDGNLRYQYIFDNTLNVLNTDECVIGKHIVEVIPDNNEKLFFQKLETVLKEQKSLSLVTSLNGLLSKDYLVLMFPYHEGVCVVFMGLPFGLNEIYKKLFESEQRWKFALEGAKDGLWDWNLKTNEVFFSTQWKAMLGFEEDEIKGSLDEWSNRVHPEDLQSCYDDIQKHLDKEEEIYSNIHRVKCKDGSYIWVLDRGKVVEFDENGAAVRMVGTHTDLTERMETERILNNRNKELEQFSYITSHDLQEPLNSIISFTRLLDLEKDKMSAVGQKSIEIISSSAYRMKEFIVSLLEYSKIGKEKEKTKVDLIQVIADLKTDLYHLIEQKGAVVEYIGNAMEISVFKQDFIKLLQNLIVNGIKYSVQGKRPHIIITAEESDFSINLSVKDNGIGIAKDHFEKIFEVFQRLHTRDQYTGTGIGLSYCKKVVELHKGEIWLDSELGKGTTFNIKLSKT